MFGKNLKIGEGQKNDLTQVSKEGLKPEEIAELAKKNAKLIDIYKVIAGKDGTIDKLELADAMDSFASFDQDGNGKISKKELNAGTAAINKAFNTQFESKDIKEFIKAMNAAGKGSEKQSVKSVQKEAADALEAKRIADETAAADTTPPAVTDVKAEAPAAEAPVVDPKKTPTDYTVQNGDNLTVLLKKSLKGQGIENPTAEQLKEAKEEFINNNPKAVHGPKGKEFLWAGDVVKIAGGLEDKANAADVKNAYSADQAAKTEAKRQADAAAAAKQTAEVQDAKITAEAKRRLGQEDVQHNLLKLFEKPELDFSDIPLVLSPKAREEAIAERRIAADPEALEKMKAKVQNEFESEVVRKSEPPIQPQVVKERSASQQKSPAQIQKQITDMEKHALCEELPNGFSRRDLAGYNDGYYDKDGNRISKEQYNKARGTKTRLIDNMVASPIMEQLSNGYTKRDNPGSLNRCYDKDGHQISEAEFQRAKKAEQN